MAVEKINIGIQLDPESVGGGNIVFSKGSGSKNALYSKYTDGRLYAEQRPGLDSFATPPKSLGGRGIYYWEAAEKFISVIDDLVYEGAYAATIAPGIDPGRDPVYFAEMSPTKLVMTDPQNDKVWLFTNSGGALSLADLTPTVNAVVNITAEGLAGGVVVLNQTCYLLTEEGRIYNSELGNVELNWPGGNILCQRSPDPGVYLGKQSEMIVAFGASTIEMFLDAGNPDSASSPLQRREDISYSVGALNRKTVYFSGDTMYFIGGSTRGSYGLYVLDNLQLEYLSHDTMDAWINSTAFNAGFDFIISGGRFGEHHLVYITSVLPQTAGGVDGWVGIFTVVYDATQKVWGHFETLIYEDGNGLVRRNCMPIVDTSERVAAGVGGQVFQFLDGQLLRYNILGDVLDGFTPTAYVTEFGGVDDDQNYIENQSGYIEPAPVGTVLGVQFAIVTEQWDGGTLTKKFGNRLEVVGRPRLGRKDEDEDMQLSWTKDTYATYSIRRPLRTLMDRKLTRLGWFERIAFRLEYSGTDRIRIERLELDMKVSSYR